MARGVSIRGDEHDNLLVGGAGNDFIYGFGGSDELRGGGGDDQLQGGDGDDRLYGEAGRDTLYGQGGSDLLDGGEGADQLFAGGIVGGGDTLTGGGGADLFAWVGSFAGTDIVTDFQQGVDKIDLARIDADERTAPGTITGRKTPGNEAFRIVSSSDGATPGELVITTSVDESGQTITVILGYTNTEAGADFEIHLLGAHALTAADFLL